jgi:BirA family biotin operon repressor/biotin-[acetyl-CoA-carboxylase] ligase
MKNAAALAERGEPHGTVVVADQQTAGIGRQGHVWHSASAGGLYFSIILRLDLAPDRLPILTMALGLAVQKAVNERAKVATDLRWPNDVLLRERKLAGILVHSADRGALIAGIGLNVNQSEFPEDLRDIATSLRIETGREHSREDLLDAVVAECLAHSDMEKGEILRRFGERSSFVCGKSVQVDGKICGITAGLDENGFLLIRTEHGMETVIAGGVRPL